VHLCEGMVPGPVSHRPPGAYPLRGKRPP
jgi:hypothetical protein